MDLDGAFWYDMIALYFLTCFYVLLVTLYDEQMYV